MSRKSFLPSIISVKSCDENSLLDCNYFQFIQYGRTSKVQYVTCARTITDQNYIKKLIL